MCLPLEFRGSDPSLRRNMEIVIEFMINSDSRGVKLIELITPPDLNQARVNRCLIALVNRKIVQKDSASGSVLYHWHGLS
jgi:DASH complex subunit DAM1